MPVANVKSKWVDGDLYFYDKAGNEIFHIDGTNRKLLVPSGSVLDLDAATTTLALAAGTVGADELTANLKKGFIPLDLFSAQIIGSNEIPDSGNFLDGNTAPEIKRVNAATDKQAFVNWIANGVEEIQFAPFVYPPDLDDASAVEVHLLARMAAGGMDTPVIAVGYFEGIGDTNAGGNTAALSTTLAEVTVTIAAGDVGAHPKTATVTLTPAAHANEAIELYAVWIEYTRKD
jgi:hypothetical protein